ncbi:MAG TPA: hypothetical protein VF116_15045 [Ktedonobacterales bacterium]
MPWSWFLACGPINTAIDQPAIALWTHATLASGGAMLLQAPATAFFLRGSGTPFWRRRAVLLPALCGVVVIALMVWVVNASGADADSALGTLTLLALVAILGTLLSVLWGTLYTLAEAPDRLMREGLRAHETPHAT